jgi:hypothetical protein
LRADDAKLLMLGIWVPHVDGKTRLPDRQAENRLVIGNCGRTELQFVSVDPILDASVDQATFGAAAQIMQLLGFCSDKVREFSEILLRRASCAGGAAVEMLLVKEIAGDSVGIQPDFRRQIFMKYFEHSLLLHRDWMK